MNLDVVWRRVSSVAAKEKPAKRERSTKKEEEVGLNWSRQRDTNALVEKVILVLPIFYSIKKRKDINKHNCCQINSEILTNGLNGN